MSTTLRALLLFLGAFFGAIVHAGHLTVTLSPSQAVNSGAQWRVDGGSWKNSGATVRNLSNTTHTVQFKSITGWLTPASTTVNITAGNTTTLTATYVRPAALRINLTPGAAQWRIDGGAWRASGSTATGLTPGDHTIDYNSLGGYAAPASETVTLVANQTTTLNRSYTQLATVTVTLSPTAGQWSIDGGAWQTSGATVANLAPGTHTIAYSSVANHTSPPGESITLAEGQSLSLQRSYAPFAQILISLVPSSGQWRANGSAWQLSGSSLFVPAGDYTIEYSSLPGYTAPATETVSLDAAGVFATTRSYAPDVASVRVSLNPASGQWRIDSGPWQTSGAIVENVPIGQHTIDYSSVVGYQPLANETVELTKDQALQLTRSYAPEPASLTVTLAPSSAQWRVDGGAWLGSGGTASNLAPGTHTVEFAPAYGYATPDAQTITLSPAETRTLSVNYTPVGSVNVTFNPNWIQGQWRIDGGNWRSGGTTAYDLAVNVPHTIEYSDVDGYVTPPAETVTVAGGEYRFVTATYIQLASVYVSTDPNWLGAQWRIDGGAWRDAGTSAYNLSFDEPHTIDFAPVEGYVGPASQTVTLSAGEWRNVTGTYVPLASVYVNTDPNWIAAQWRIDNGPWRDAGTSAYNLSFDEPHTIDFAPVTGYVAPASQTVTLSAGEWRSVTGTYVPLASVYVNTDPNWIAAQWRIDNGPWRDAGTSVYNLSFDTPHTVEFGDVPNYLTPAPQTFTLSAGETRFITGSYTPLASVFVSLDLSVAKWRVDGGRWNNASTSVYGLSLGTHTIEYSQHDGYLQPAAETVTLNSGSNWISRTYATDPAFVFDYSLSSLTVHLDPSFAEWRIDGGRWNTSSATRVNLAPGTYTIEYAPLGDYISPPSETITLAPSSGYTLYTPYISIDPAQLTITTNPSSGQWRVYPYQWPAGGAWRASGETVTGLNPGAYTVEYTPVSGYDAPYLTYVNLLPNDSQSLAADYQPRMFQYKIVLNPSTARFRLNGSAWMPSGSTAMGHQPGDHLIEFEPVSGYATPAPVTVTFQAGANETLTFTYTPL